MTGLIHRGPQVLAGTVDRREDFIEVPPVAWLRPTAPELIGIRPPELPAPLPDRFISHDRPTCEQQLFDVAIAQVEAEL